MRKINWLLVLIFSLALFLRVFMLSYSPAGFGSDSIDVAYVGKFLVIHGRDPAGNILPFYFNKFGDFRPSGLFYLSGVFELLLGSSVFSVRLVAALFGSFSTLVVFFFTKELFKRKEIAYFASLFLAVLPWDIVLSRDVHEAIVSYFFTIAGFYLLLRFVSNNKRRKYLFYAAILLLAGFFFYHGTRTLTPILLLVFWLLYRGRDLAWLFVVFLVLTLGIIVSPYGGGRLGQVVFYKSPGEVKKPQELSYMDTNIATARIFHNKVVVYGRDVLSTWVAHFSPDFLLIKGGFPERYVVPEAGLAYFTLIFAMLAGVIYIAKKPREVGLVLAWLLISPVQAALTYEDIPSVTRASFMIFPIVILAGAGLFWILELLRKSLWKRTFLAVFFLLMSLETTYFMHQYLVHQKGNKGILRGEGNLEIGSYINSQKGNYDLVLAPYEDNMPFYFLFLGNHFDGNIKIDIADRSSGFSYQNVNYLRVGCPSHFASEYTGKKVLYIDDAWCEARPNMEEVYRVTRTDASVAWLVKVAK